MQEIIQPQARGRSNSLQRMLDLEKKLNFQRNHQGSVPPSPTVTDSSVPPSPGFAPRRFELVPKDKKVPLQSETTMPCLRRSSPLTQLPRELNHQM
ncbi:hypothetical protein NW754_001706 [Fusarium falciforme]|nr:hypothetical protein NW754_001706 [Fusarium falciforme]